MTLSGTVPTDRASRTDWVAVAEELAPAFAARAAGHDADDTFVSENYADLRRRRVARRDVRGAAQAGPRLLVHGAGLVERLFRDVQGARYHALRGAAQRRHAGRLALGLDVDE